MIQELNKLNKENIKEKHIEMSNYPNPIFRREKFESLNGEWDFIFDPNNIGEEEKWYKYFPEDHINITVPYVYQSKSSNIQENTQSGNKHDFVWYRRFTNIKNIENNYILKFGAIDYHAKVYINGHLIGTHTGGFTPFSFEVSKFLVEAKNEIIIKVEDFLYKEDILRGKQFWEEKSRAIWYTQSTGIWQNVWLERTNKAYIEKFKITPNLDKGKLEFNIINKNIQNTRDYKLLIQIRFGDDIISNVELTAKDNNAFSVDVLGDKIFNYSFHGPGRVWSPENPVLFDIDFTLYNIENTTKSDSVQTYSAMRKVHTEDGLVHLNNRPYYQRLVLDQGYWPNSLMTGTSFEHLKDILLAKNLGFNGARKHEKVESSHYYYWADVIGFLVWAEIPSAMMFNERLVKQSFLEWTELIDNYYNHPSIIAWVPLNESWGVSNISQDDKQLSYALSIYHFTKSLDQSRIVVNNDGWEISKSDIVAVHSYNHGNPDQKQIRENFKKMFETKEVLLQYMPASRNIILNDYIHENINKPFLLTEFGGISFVEKNEENWGYSVVESEDLYLSELNDIFKTVIESTFIQGYCYTQLYDVEQETNGLLTYEREYKVDPEEIKKITLRHKTIIKNKTMID